MSLRLARLQSKTLFQKKKKTNLKPKSHNKKEEKENVQKWRHFPKDEG
jgi:hypothetical protein